jgi:hypothetical protein
MEILSEKPGLKNSYYNDELRYEIYPEIIFVFGSNLAGRHGKGAAATAHNCHGAIYGVGTGLMGSSYAIPTKDVNIRTLPLSVIELYIKQFVRFTNLTELDFFVTPVGTGLAGFRHHDIAHMFEGVRNCWLPHSWKQYLENQKE